MQRRVVYPKDSMTPLIQGGNFHPVQFKLLDMFGNIPIVPFICGLFGAEVYVNDLEFRRNIDKKTEWEVTSQKLIGEEEGNEDIEALDNLHRLREKGYTENILFQEDYLESNEKSRFPIVASSIHPRSLRKIIPYQDLETWNINFLSQELGRNKTLNFDDDSFDVIIL